MARARTKSRKTTKKRKKPKLGTGKRFAALEKKIAKSGARNPGAVAAAIGRKKYGKKRMGKWSGAGRHRAAVRRHRKGH